MLDQSTIAFLNFQGFFEPRVFNRVRV